ncbi:MAG: hypothetical protein NY202_04980 [Mollicutes bacterium UO1]
MFTDTQIPLENERNEYARLEGKTYKDIKVGNNFGGNSKIAKKAFEQMAGRHDYQEFNFITQKDQQSASSSSSHPTNPQSPTNFQIIQDVKNNPRN